MRLREEVIFLTLFNISSKSRLSLDNFASIAALCLTGATEFQNKMTFALWQKVGADCCGLKEQEIAMIYNLFEATLACGIRGVIRSLPTVHRFIVFLFSVIFRHSMLSKKSAMATDDAWPLSMNGEDLDSLIKSYFSLNVNILSAPASPALASGCPQARPGTSASGIPTYEYDDRYNHIRIRSLSKAGIGVFAAATHRPPTAVIANCANCTIFLIAPCSHVVIANCRNVKIVLGTVAGTVSMCYCMRMTFSAVADFFKANTIENCLMYVTSRNSCVHDSNTKTNKIAPYNYIFPSLEDCLQQQGLADICQQGESFGMKLYSPLGLGVCENLIFMDPKTYCTAVVPFDSKLLTGKTKALPIILPSVFRQTMKERSEKLTVLGRKIRDPSLTAEQKAAFEAYCKSAFVSWVKANMLTTELLEITTARMYELE